MPRTIFTSRRIAARLLPAVAAIALLTSSLPSVSSAASGAGRSRTAHETEARQSPLTPAEANAARSRFEEVYSASPLQFEVNRGQADRRFDFLSRAGGYDVLVSPTETVFALKEERREKRGNSPHAAPHVVVLGMKLVGASAGAAPSGEGQLAGRVNYFKGGDSPQKRVDIPTYSGVRYGSVYPGVDVVYYGKRRELEYDFVVAPGGDSKRIKLKFNGAGRVKLDAQTGDLVLGVGVREVRQHRPVAYQETGGARREVAARYVWLGASTVGIKVGDYDKSLPLVIDPVLSYSTYVGGSGFDSGGGVAVDAAGNIYVTGQTSSADFPTTPGTFRNGAGLPNSDLFIMKINPKSTGASGIIFSTYIGGGGHSLDIALDPAGNIYVTGGSSSPGYPVSANAFQPNIGGSDDGTVLKLSAAGNALLYSSYIGGRSSDGCKGIAVDAAGNIYVAGHAYSDNIQTTPGAFQPAFGGMQFGGGNGDGDAFVAKINPSAATGAASLLYLTYLGGGGGEFGGFGIAVDAAGGVYVTGRTDSANFPVTQGAFQPVKSGGNDLFITRLKPEGKGAGDLSYSTFLGGQGDDRGIGLALGRDNSVYVTGYTTSADFPTTKSALQSKPAGDRDFFVSKLDLQKTGAGALVYSTLVGGSAMDVGWDVAVDAVGNAYVTGETRSTDLPITAGAFQSAIGGVSDAFSAPGGDGFAAKLNAAGTALVYFTYLGGAEGDSANHIALDAKNNAYVSGGYTFSPNFPTTVNSVRNSWGGSSDAFVARIDNPSSFASNNLTGEALFSTSDAPSAAATDALPNPIEDSRKFVRQQYRDFLNRAPDESGLNFWTAEIEQCGTDAQCREVKRVNVSAAFFLSIEFQETGYFAYRLYRTSFARMPGLREFSPDTVIVGQGVVVNTDGWQQKLAANKTAFVDEWVERADFRSRYDALSHADYVDALFANAGVQPSTAERDTLVGGLAGGTLTRASVLRQVAEHPSLVRKESNRAFVLMQYFGYLQRSPDDPPDGNLDGYNFWLGKLEEFGGNYINAEMVKAFINSGEYRRRFGQD